LEISTSSSFGYLELLKIKEKRYMKKRKEMQLALQMVSGYGAEFSAWRMPGTDPAAYTNTDSYVERAKLAEKGKFQMIFIADTPALTVDLGPQTPMFPMDPVLALMAVARETKHIGLVATLSTTFNYPYNLARQFKALDVISHGRVGWNAVTTSEPLAAANFGAQIASRNERYDMAHESIQIIQALWGSWEQDAWTLDVDGGKYADMDKIKPINLEGQYYAPRGPLPIPHLSKVSQLFSKQAEGKKAWNWRGGTLLVSMLTLMTLSLHVNIDKHFDKVQLVLAEIQMTSRCMQVLCFP
jgi:hypothetical protein